MRQSSTHSSIDDILIHAKTEDKLRKLTWIIEPAGIQLNQDKCIFNQTLVKFLEHIFAQQASSRSREAEGNLVTETTDG